MILEINSFPCVLCENEKYYCVFPVTDFNGAISKFSIIACDNCGLAKTQPELSEEELCNFYDKEYYGSGNRKFASANPV